VKRFSVLIALIVLMLISFIALSCSFSKTPAGPPLKVQLGIDATYPPFELFDMNTKKLTGFDVELMNAIAVKANLDISYTMITYPNMLKQVAACQLDGAISAIVITDSLKQEMAFSDPYYTFGEVVVIKEENPSITGRDSLNGKTVGAQSNTTSASEAQLIVQKDFKPYQNFELAFNDLMFGFIDAVIADKPTALIYTTVPANKLKIVGDEFAKESYGVAICKQKADLAPRINVGIAAVKADGTLKKLEKKWILNGGQ